MKRISFLLAALLMMGGMVMAQDGPENTCRTHDRAYGERILFE